MLMTSTLYLVRVPDFLTSVLEYLQKVPSSVNDIDKALPAGALKMHWFTMPTRAKRELLKKIQELKFQQMMDSASDKPIKEENDGA